VTIGQKLGPDIADASFGSIGEEYRTAKLFHDTVGDRVGQVTTNMTVGPFFPSANDALEANYADDRAKIRSGLAWQGGAMSKISDPLKVDVGPGNINLGTALDLLKTYNANPTNQGKGDLFNLNRFNGRLDYFYEDLLNPKSKTSVYVAALKIADVRNFYLHAEQYQGPSWTVSARTAKALRAAYLNSSGTARAELLNAGYKTAYSTLAKNAEKGKFGPPPRDGWIDYFKDPLSPFKKQKAILRGKPL
jgi:hypothetical protein